MHKTLGEILDIPGEMQAWTIHKAAVFAVLNAVISLKLLDQLDAGPLSAEELAHNARLPVDKVRRLMTFLSAEGVFEDREDGRLARTARSDALKYMGPHILMTGVAHEAALQLPAAMRNGTTAYEERFGMPAFAHLKSQPELGKTFADVMSITTANTEQFIFTQHQFMPFALAVDVGGSHGSLLLRLLSEYPNTQGCLFDLPETALRAKESISTSPLADRVKIEAGDFFKAVPHGGDLYLLKQILHDWNDEECLQILKNIRSAITSNGRIAVVERIIPETNQAHHAFDLDIQMMVWTTGRERKLSEFEQLFSAAGFALDTVSHNPTGMSVIEAMAIN